MIRREGELKALKRLLNRHPVVGIIGARQVGKTTLARDLLSIQKRPSAYYDLENPQDLAKLADPMLALKERKGIVVIDEVHRAPRLFEVLRVLADRPGRPARFLVLGSATPELLRQSSESLAGRIVYHELRGFWLEEVGLQNHKRLWLRGGFPRSYLPRTTAESVEWRQSFVRNFLERDLREIGITISPATMRRFWTMLAHYHGQTWNASELARSFGVSDITVRNYLDLLSHLLVVRPLMPWFENIAKRQVKAPKVYIADSGILHTLLNLNSMDDLLGHPKLGASWEGFVVEQVVRRLKVRPEECYFWATHAGAELDLLVVRGKRRFGFEIKRTSSPGITPSMRIALSDLKLQRLDVIHAGEETFPLNKNIRAIAITDMFNVLKPLPLA